jgi:hypothetical protein
MIKITAILLIIAGTAMSNFAWLPKTLIKKLWTLKIPIGTSMEKAVEIIESDYQESCLIRDSGYGIRYDAGSRTPDYNATPVICSKSINVTLDRDLFGIVWAIAYFGFNDVGHLVDISIDKERRKRRWRRKIS